MTECNSVYKDSEGLCRFKFVGGDDIYCICKDISFFKCIEEDKQKKIVKLRWNRVRKSK